LSSSYEIIHCQYNRSTTKTKDLWVSQFQRHSIPGYIVNFFEISIFSLYTNRHQLS